jgi:perosamine synthetase
MQGAHARGRSGRRDAATALPGPRDPKGMPVRRGRPWRVYPRHRLDLGFSDLVFALGACAFARRGETEAARTERELGGRDAVVCASLRSGFELLLDALALPEGSEVLVSAVTHPDMVRIVERHGLVPVPVDLDVETLAPRLDVMERAVTARTRAVLVAHLFGGRVDLAPVIRLAERHRLLVLEDCAQSFAGPGDRGDERAAVSLFSFGTIKTCPALGGGVVRVRLPGVAERMRELEPFWPRQRRRDYAARVIRFVGLRALEAPLVYGLFVRLGAAAGLDTDALVNRAVHALRPPSSGDADSFERWLRRRPSAPLLAVLRRRVRSFDHGRLRHRAERGEELAGRLPAGVVHPGRAALARTHWVFPVVATDPSALVRGLAAVGFDATRATTSITAVEPPAGSGLERPRAAVALLERIVFVPAYPELPESAVDRLAGALASVAGEREP